MGHNYFKSQKESRQGLRFSTVFLSLVALLLIHLTAFSQNVGINENGALPDNSAGLDVSFNDKGLLVPRLTTAERDAILSPAMSLLIFNTETECFEAWNSNTSAWVAFGCIAVPSGMSCGNSFTDSRDSKSYETVAIGTQCWMAENLNYDAGSNSYCNDCATYGRLYTWGAAMDNSSSSSASPSGIQGVCPDGWHLPSDAEWCELENTVEANIDATCSGTGWRGSTAGKHLKISSWSIGDNASGFTALPAGYQVGASSGNMNSDAYFWTATEDSGSNAWIRHIGSAMSNYKRVSRVDENKNTGFSVRCVKD